MRFAKGVGIGRQYTPVILSLRIRLCTSCDVKRGPCRAAAAAPTTLNSEENRAEHTRNGRPSHLRRQSIDNRFDYGPRYAYDTRAQFISRCATARGGAPHRGIAAETRPVRSRRRLALFDPVRLILSWHGGALA